MENRKFGIYADFLKDHKYIGPKIALDAFGTKMICFGFWFFHIYVDTGDRYESGGGFDGLRTSAAATQ